MRSNIAVPRCSSAETVTLHPKAPAAIAAAIYHRAVPLAET